MEVSKDWLREIMTKTSEDFYEELGQRLAKLRKQSHITQVEMAKILGVSQQQITSYEKGRVKVPIAALPTLAKVLGVPIEEIVGIQTPAKRGPASKLQRQMEQIAELPRAKQKFIIEMLDALIQQEKKAS